MQRFFGISQDINGNAIPSVAVTVNLAGTGTSATLYSDGSYTPLANPFTSNADGTYQFYAQNGRYDVTLVKTGYTFSSTETSDIALVDIASTLTPPQITSDQNDYSPTNGLNNTVWRISSDVARAITGIQAGRTGQVLTLLNVGSFSFTIADQSGSSSAANRIITGAGADITLASNGALTLQYDTVDQRWRAVGLIAGSVAPVSGVSVTAGTLVGLTLANDTTDPTNDISVLAGAASSDDTAVSDRDSMVLPTRTLPPSPIGIIKRSDANWTVGDGAGGLDTGVVGDNWYHVFLIKRTDTGVVDVLFSLSAASPTMPASYTKKRRIGSFLRSGGTIVSFTQVGDEFLWLSPPLDVNTATSGTSAVTTVVTVPTGVTVWAFGLSISTTSHVYISSPSVTDLAPSATAAPLAIGGAFTTIGIPWGPVRTDSSAQVRYRCTANNVLRMATRGWLDRRGRDD